MQCAVDAAAAVTIDRHEGVVFTAMLSMMHTGVTRNNY